MAGDNWRVFCFMLLSAFPTEARLTNREVLHHATAAQLAVKPLSGPSRL